jgi:hypothetical protein
MFHCPNKFAPVSSPNNTNPPIRLTTLLGGKLYLTPILESVMDENRQFFVTSMPTSRMAHYYLGWYGGSVFIDFNNDENGLVKLVRISFDGYGCCNIKDAVKSINSNDSKKFKEMVTGNCIRQTELYKIISGTLRDNESLLWNDALIEYGLI